MPSHTSRAAPHAGTLPLSSALDQSAPLTSLLARLHDSRLRLQALNEVLPPYLCDQVRAGPVDDSGWTLLASSGAAAAKLRQLLPVFEDTLVAKGWQRTSIKVRVQSA